MSAVTDASPVTPGLPQHDAHPRLVFTANAADMFTCPIHHTLLAPPFTPQPPTSSVHLSSSSLRAAEPTSWLPV